MKTDTDPSKINISELVLRSFEGVITDEEFTLLDKAVRADEETAQRYVNLVSIYAGLYCRWDFTAGFPTAGDSSIKDAEDFKKELETHVKTELLPNSTNSEVQLKHNLYNLFESDIQFKKIFWEIIEKDLRQLKTSAISAKTTPFEPLCKRRTLTSRDIMQALGKVAAVVIICFALIWLDHMIYTNSPAGPEKMVVAEVTGNCQGRWDAMRGNIPTGRFLENGPLYLQSGIVQIKFQNQATVILEAPAEIEILSPSSMFLREGKLVAQVPREATGFTIKTPVVKILDLGTEFGVQVDRVRNSEVHVFRGEVMLYPKATQSRLSVRQKQAKRIGNDSRVRTIALDRTRFVQAKEFDARVKALAGKAYDRWLAYSYQLARDPNLVVYYTFDNENEASDRLFNRSGYGPDLFTGMLGEAGVTRSQPTWTRGRWPEKSALRFDRGRQQTIEVPYNPKFCISGAITIGAWIKLPSRSPGGHIVSNRLDNIVNYQLGIYNPPRQKGIQFLRYNNTNTGSVYSNRNVPVRTGWMFICVSNDGRVTRFYINGKLFDSCAHPYKSAPVPAPLWIGTARVTGQDYSEQMFNGVIGELMIFNRMLSSAKIKHIYEMERP